MVNSVPMKRPVFQVPHISVKDRWKTIIQLKIKQCGQPSTRDIWFYCDNNSHTIHLHRKIYNYKVLTHVFML